MNADEAREQACHALAARLRAWGITDCEVRARDFVAGLYVAGWRWQAVENRPVPPRRHEECRIHAGQWAERCGGCAADAKAITEPRVVEAARSRDTSTKPPLPRTKEVPQ